MVDRRTLLSGMLAGSAMLGLAGCASNGQGGHSAEEAEQVSCMRYRVGRPGGIDPLLIEDRAGCIVAAQLFDPLTRIDAASGAVVPAACLTYSVSDDARTFTFVLREGVTFHNGERVTSHAFRRAWERLLGDALALETEKGAAGNAYRRSAYARLLKDVEGYTEGTFSDLTGVRCPDDNTLVVALTSPCADFPRVVAHPALAPVPEVALADPEGFAAAPIGNGPFRMKEPWDFKKKTIHLETYDGYGEGKPAIDGVQFSLEPRAETAYKQFQAGNLDVCDVPVDQYDDAEEEAGVSADGRTVAPSARLAHSVEPALLYLVCNTTISPLNMPDVRCALSLAIDAEALCEQTLKYSYAPASSPVSPCVGEVRAWGSATYDPDRTAELLEPLFPANASGVRDIALSLAYRAGGVQKRVAEQVKSDLQEAGIAIQLRPLEAEELDAAYRNGDYELGLCVWAPPCAALSAFAEPLLRSGSAAGASWSRYSRGEVDALLDEARAALDEGKRRELYLQALALAGEDVPLIPLAHPTHTKVASDRVTHLVIGADGVPELSHAVL